MSQSQSQRADGRPTCIDCGDPAFAVVGTVELDVLPYCYACSSTQIDAGSTEYPLDSCYNDGRVTQMCYEGRYHLFDPTDSEQESWIEAKNTDVPGSFVNLAEWI